MNWLVIVALLIAIYAVIAGYIWYKKLWGDRITFYGPILALKSNRVGIFDIFARYRTFLRIYGTIGVVMVIIISVLISFLLFLSVQFTIIYQPEPTGIYEPQNILLLPGINEFIPSTFAVWMAFLITIFIHEFGHGLLSRVENISVRSVGALIAVIPIGFFVEPDEEELENLKGLPKARMFGAGITNNMVVGFACFSLLILLMGMAVPMNAPIIQGIYEGYPAEAAGIPGNSGILEVNGIAIHSREDISRILAETRPGDEITLTIEHRGEVTTHTLTLAEWPEEFDDQETGFMGISYFDAQVSGEIFSGLASPLGFLRFLAVPFDMSLEGQYLKVLAFDTIETSYYTVPFPFFWDILHLLFWSSWININVGIFNAIPMVPLDGGYIMQEGVTRFFERRKMVNIAKYIVGGISWLMLFMIISIILLPYLFHL
jgi:membrane-associated protease RseP (regulator of RpoE activity)